MWRWMQFVMRSSVLLTIYLGFTIGNSNPAGQHSSATEKSAGLRSEVADQAEDVRPLLVGSEVPSVTLKDIDGKMVNLRKVALRQPTVFVFYRGGWCPYCNLHLKELKEIEADLKKAGFQIVAISPDRGEELRKTLTKNKLGYQLLSDSNAAAAKAFGLAFRVDKETRDKYKQYKIDLEAASGEKHHILPVPAVYVSTTDGLVHFQYVNPNYKVRLSGPVVLAAARDAVTKKK